jgi:hypothetical protein
MADKKRIEQQVNAEFAFTDSLEVQGVDCSLFMKQWKLSRHLCDRLDQCLRERWHNRRTTG